MTTTAGGYALLDFGEGRRLEQWGAYRLVRPDPTARGGVGKPAMWRTADAVYEGEKGRGRWVERTRLPEHWGVEFDDLTLAVRLAPYKHTGVFPEQLENWRWVRERGRAAGRGLSVLNLFAYTGGASVALAKDGHFVTHVDAAKPSIGWAKTNAEMNGLPGDRIRWILEDVPKFVAREIRRGKRYDGIILDPPAFGHSPTGKTWRVERDLGPLLEDCRELLSERAAFLVLNGYAQNDSPSSFHRLLSGVLRGRAGLKDVRIEAGELSLVAGDGRELSTGIVARCGFV